MKTLLLILFFRIVRIFSRDINIPDKSLDHVLDHTSYLDFEHLPTNSLKKKDLGQLEVNNVFGTETFHPQTFLDIYVRSYDLLDSEVSTLVKRDALSVHEEVLLETLASYLKESFDKSSCLTLMNFVCPQAASYPGISEAIRTLLLEKCSKKEDTCTDAVQKLPRHCEQIKQVQQHITYSFSTCKLHKQKCKSLKLSCNETLTETCKNIDEKCFKYHDSVIVNYHTMIVDKTIFETETVHYTQTEVVFQIKTCCDGKVHYTTCQPTQPLEPTTPSDPEESGEDEVPEKPEEHDSMEPEEPSIDDKGCSITFTEVITKYQGGTTTETVTVTVTLGTKDGIRDKGDGTRMGGLKRVSLIYSIIGIMVGVWIFV